MSLADPVMGRAARPVAVSLEVVAVPRAPAAVAALLAGCPPEERRRANGADGRHVAGVVVARLAVAAALGEPIGSVRLGWDGAGRPRAVAPRPAGVSIAHDGPWAAAVAVADPAIAVGVDLAPIDRLRRTDGRTAGALRRRLSGPGDDVGAAAAPDEVVAVTLAAKEAAGKALGLRPGAGSWHDLRCEVPRSSVGSAGWSRCRVRWSDGRAGEVAWQARAGEVLAVAVAVAGRAPLAAASEVAG